MLSDKDILYIRKQFPILKKKIYKNPLIYLDNAATTQKPIQVINAIKKYYTTINANVHRGAHYLSQIATNAIENSRLKIKNFINARYSEEIIFTRNTTEAINLVALGISNFIKPGDEILISYLEHHSNIVPWQMLCERTKTCLKVIPIDKEGTLKWEVFEQLISVNTKIVAITHLSNVLGINPPVKKFIKKAHTYGAKVLIDGAQALSHLVIDVQNLDADFYVFSAHKMYGPTGVGVLYGKKNSLEKLLPYQGGGEMIKNVTFEKTIYADIPYKFEAGTPNIEGIVAWSYAIDFIENIGMNNIILYEKKLLDYITYMLSKINGIIIYSQYIPRIGIISFNISDIHPFDIGLILDRLGIAVRTGHHCAQPIIDFFKILGTVRISISIYNTFEEIDYLYKAILKANKMLKK
ncbi:MAG: cysteine desulfurase [Candidatus Bostrichicola ureolyticus]|nr:MAG: cysteine desulfurase [Candidatus Bostrichicola ureolyticus]